MMKKIAVVESCNECPFFERRENECLCKRTNLRGDGENLFKVCPLPDVKP